MSTSYANLSFFNTEQERLVDAIVAKFPGTPCVVSDADPNWTTVFQEEFLTMTEILPQWGTEISRQIRRPAISLEIWYSSVFCYWIFGPDGAIIDSSSPANPETPTRRESFGNAGQPQNIPHELFGHRPISLLLEKAIEAANTPVDVFYSFSKALEIKWFEWNYEDFFALNDIVGFDKGTISRFQFLQ